MKPFCLIWAFCLAISTLVQAQDTNGWTDAQMQGHDLAQKLLSLQPTTNATNTGTLQVRGPNHNRFEVPVEIRTFVYGPQWNTIYLAHSTNQPPPLYIIQTLGSSNVYLLRTNTSGGATVPILGDIPVLGHLFPFGPRLTGADLDQPFAGSDFWICDLGLEFFHWPGQKVLKKEVHRSCGCTVLESTNPSPDPHGYSRVVSWIDDETSGIVEANAYDAAGKLLKDFYPKDLKKVSGRWQVQTLVMENEQTGSRSRLQFDLSQP